MTPMTKEEFYSILHKPDSECDGCEIHLKRKWEEGNAKSIFYITGLDFSTMLSNSKQKWEYRHTQ